VQRVFVLGLIILTVPVCAWTFDDGDFQYWNNESVSKKINDNWKLSFNQEFRWGDNASNPYYRHSDLGITYSGLAKWLDLTLSYRHITEERSGSWKVENQPNLNADVKWKLWDVAFGNKLRLEYRNREDADNFWRYRNKLTIKAPFKLTKLEIQPYIADEIFYDFDVETLNKNRLFAGFSLKILKNLDGEIYHLWESSEKSDQWNDTHVLGTKLKFSF